MKTTIRLLAASSFAAAFGAPVFAQTEIDIGALTCAEYVAMDADNLVAVLDAFGGATLPSDQMADDGVANNEIDPKTSLEPSAGEGGAEVANAMSEADLATAAMQTNSGSTDLGATITVACEGTPDVTIIAALEDYMN